MEKCHPRVTLLTSLTVPANPRTEVSKCTKEIDFAKVWPQGFDEIELRVSALPEHKVAEALLT